MNVKKNMIDKHKPSLGVVAISYNEEVDLPGFLNNLLPWVDEIVVVDSGSSDNSLQILSDAGEKVKVIRQEMTEDGFAGQRNAGIKAASSDWLLNMDIDERVPPALADEIRNIICDADYNAFRYRRANFFLHRRMKGGAWNSWNNPQLARRGCHHYINKVHEQCVVEGGEGKIGQLQNVMWHLNDESYKERMNKSFQYCQLEAEKLSSSGIIVKWRRILCRPVLSFVKQYFFKRGFVDGVPGLISAMHAACAEFRANALVWDEQNRIKREELEKQIADMWGN